ncbi:metalloregulator ArsR/SmtB family transcription factor [Arenibaculum sp.]|jgi:ArsR family transcriptional regulator|uniref:ArsR/SmtB family transcription factor n=1 Tax=Arenibaculum sp. TaxID=2865862 RepID=UPI002E131F6D|nr:metalloregulator ArsR/SmtB family transcription factor [Arenibaculum sp.]
MDLVTAFKALSNPIRLKILDGLQDPARHFPPQDEGDVEVDGVCVGSIQEGIGLSQSSTSDYLGLLHKAGLVTVKRRGQWTYYKRDEAGIQRLAEMIRTTVRFELLENGSARGLRGKVVIDVADKAAATRRPAA